MYIDLVSELSGAGGGLLQVWGEVGHDGHHRGVQTWCGDGEKLALCSRVG